MSTPSLLNIPYRLKAGTLYSQLPETGAGDFTVTRTTTPTAGQSTRINSLGNIELVANNVPRLDYPLGGAVNGCPALLVEPAGTNFLVRSEEFDNASWNKNATGINTSIGTNGIQANVAISPDGTQNADRVNFNLQTDLDLGLNQNYAAATTGQVYNTSIWFRGEGTNIGKQIKVRIKRTSGGSFVGSDATITLTSGWVRFASSAITLVASNSGVQVVVSSNDATDALIWGAQLEAGSVATSYIPTTTAAVTRNTETIANTSATALIGQSEGTLYWDIAAVVGVLSGTGNPMFGVRNSGTTNWVSLTSNSPSNPFRVTARITLGTVIIDYQANITSGKAALAWSSAGLALYVNGSLVATSATNPNFSFSVAEFSGYAPFKANAFAIYPNRIPNTAAPGVLSLATLTTP